MYDSVGGLANLSLELDPHTASRLQGPLAGPTRCHPPAGPLEARGITPLGLAGPAQCARGQPTS